MRSSRYSAADALGWPDPADPDMRFSVPKQLTLLNAAHFVHSIQRRSELPDIEIDFTNIAFVYPAGTVLLAVGMRQWLADRQENGLH
jgi:hypothetical protein